MSSKTNNRPKSSQGSNNNKEQKPANAWSTPNAWSRPLKPRPPPPPGLALQQDPVNRERFLHLVLSLVGQKVTLHHQDGTILNGIFHTFTPFDDLLPSAKKNQLVVKAVNIVQPGAAKISNGSTVVISADQIISLHCKSLRLGMAAPANTNGNGFRTDTEISKVDAEKGRDLVAAGSAWTSATSSRAEGLDSRAKGLKGQIGEWDQFKANEELFNVQAKFDENIYTTALDKSNLDLKKIKEAERMAREIESTTSSNIHLAEERNQVIQGDFDEEDRYSGVLTTKLEARIKDQQPTKKAMNYAAAAAKADKILSTGLSGTKKEQNKNDTKKEEEKKTEGVEETKLEEPTPAKQTDVPASKTEENVESKPIGEIAKTTVIESTTITVVESKNEIVEKTDDEPVAETSNENTNLQDLDDEQTKKAETKLNAKTKSFTFNPGAKAFTPSYGTSLPAAPEHPQMIDHNNGALMGIPPHMAQYMQHMGQPGMMPMMNPHFAMRYPGGYPGMEQHMPPGQPHHPQHIQQHIQLPLGQDTTTPVNANDEQSGESLAAISQHQQIPPHPGVPVPFPPNSAPYPYPGGMPMQRGPGVPHMGYHPQMVGGPHQIPVVQGRPYQQHMYAMPPGPPQMRPNGVPYYGGGPHYPHYMHGDDDYRGGGRGGGRGRGRRGGGGGTGGRKGGRGGRGGYYQPRENDMYNNGRYTPQNSEIPAQVDVPPPMDDSKQIQAGE